MNRRIMQTFAMVAGNGDEVWSQVYAFCNDGSIWFLEYNKESEAWEWRLWEAPPIPQTAIVDGKLVA